MTEYKYSDKLIFVIILIITFGACMAVYTQPEKVVDIYAPRSERCSGNADLLNRFCCVIPPFFTLEASRQCGGTTQLFYTYRNITGFIRRAYNCAFWYCCLNKYELLTPTGHLDLDKYFTHLDLWATLNPAFTNVIVDAKVDCKESHRVFLPLKPCEFFKMNQCIRNFLNIKCPFPINTKSCKQQRKFFEECGEYFT